jgi:hypothetical protein
MKRYFLLFSAVLVFSAVSFGQGTANYSGTWELDVSKSKLDQRMRVEGMTLTVAHNEKDISVTTVTKRGEMPAGGAGRGGGGGMGRGGGGFGGDGTMVYTLDGKGTKAQVGSGQFAGEATLKGKTEKDGKLRLSVERTVNTPMGSANVVTRETWSLSPDGNTLTVKRDIESPMGGISSTMVFTKQ